MDQYAIGWGGLAILNAALANIDGRGPLKYLLASLVLGPLVTIVLAVTRKEGTRLRQVDLWNGRMKTLAALVLASALAQAVAVAQDALPAEAQIAAAVLAAPEDRRSGAAVLGYDAQGALVMLRRGSNDLVCLADNPKVAAFSVACYHEDLDPFMARGRALTAQGVTDDKIRDQTRWKEVSAGTLPMPREPRILYVLTGKEYDQAGGRVTDPYLRWVIYVPFATAESTGLATKPVPNGPWLMDPGTAGAHIMISPTRPKP